MRSPRLVAEPGLVTPEWLTDVLRSAGAVGGDAAVASFQMTPIGTGQIGDNVRFSLAYDGPPGPPTVVCKFGPSDPASAAAGIQMRLYESEVAFYRDLAPTLDVTVPRCYFADVEAGTANVVIAMEDQAPAEPGDQITGCTVAQAELAMEQAARLHGPRWGDPVLAGFGWLDRDGTNDGVASVLPMIWDSFVERYRSMLDPVTLEAGPELAGLITTRNQVRSFVKTAIHGDFRLDNMLFATPAGGNPLTVVDWQTVQLGPGPHDVAYFLGNALEPDVRRSVEHALVTMYHRALVDDYGVSDYPFERCWAEYVTFSHASLVMAVFASMMVGRTDRGDEMFMVMANRSAQMAADLDASSVIRAG
jgi:hypothetical protein